MINYNKLFSLLKKNNIGQSHLQEKGLHGNVYQKLRKNELVRVDTIDKLCAILNCQPGDIMEYVEDMPEESTPKKQ